jgi:DNA-binding IclR family transcriptional regulator
MVERHLAEVAQPALQALGDASGETINLAVPGPGGVEHLAQVEGRHILGAGQWVGRQVPYHSTGVGKVFLAYGAARLPDDRPLLAHTPETITDRDALERALAAVRRDGFATVTDELEPGLSAMAAPVFSAGGTCIAALAISGPSLRLTAKRIAELRPVLLEQCRAVSQELGHDHEGADAA